MRTPADAAVDRAVLINTSFTQPLIVDLKALELFEKKFAELMTIRGPMTVHTFMPDEACLIYILDGDSMVCKEYRSLQTADVVPMTA